MSHWFGNSQEHHNKSGGSYDKKHFHNNDDHTHHRDDQELSVSTKRKNGKKAEKDGKHDADDFQMNGLRYEDDKNLNHDDEKLRNYKKH